MKPRHVPQPPPATRSPAVVERLCLSVYRQRMGEKDAAARLEKVGIKTFTNDAMAYAPIVRAVLIAQEQETAQ